MIELERTFLAKYIPNGLKNCRYKEIMDIYVPKDAVHPVIRIRKNGDTFEFTKKEPVNNDASHQKEYTVSLTEKEFKALSKIEGKQSHKIRYYYNHNGRTTAEIDVFCDKLKGLVLVDFEFRSIKNKDSFIMPDFCLVDVTHEEFLAGGMLCGKSYKSIEKKLKKYGYKKLYI